MSTATTRLRNSNIDHAKWQRLKSILAEALEQVSAAERAALVKKHCAGDTDLLREAESLLAEADAILNQPEDVFEDCAAHATRTLWEDDPSCRGRRIGAYTVVRQLGRGGMGTVYLAARADGAFEKQVAIKVLKRGTDTEEVLRRFSTERHILARLEHPNIAHLLDAGNTGDGLQYFVMEYVEGLPITRFVREHHIGINERLALFLKVCGAVEKAHKEMVIHRDLKPTNILVTGEGEAKLLDFGIAKLLSAGEDNAEVTATSAQLLTPICASPEQARGESVTTASDVYALGALLFEMLAGRTPHRFANKFPTREDLARVVCEEELPLPSVAALDAETADKLRGDLDAIVLRAMQKNPADRYESVAQFAEDIQRYLKGEQAAATPKIIRRQAIRDPRRGGKLRWAVAAVAMAAVGTTAWLFLNPKAGDFLQRSPVPATGESVIEPKSIAVLPFQNLSSAAENAFFASGVQDAILTDLAKIADLKVINRTSVQQFASDAPRDLREISAQLKVAYVLEGSVQRADNRLRITAKLTDTRSQAQIWAERYDREVADVFAIQSEISRKIADQLRATLSPKEKAALHTNATRDLVAYDLYLRAKEVDRNVGRSAEQSQKQVALLDQAVARDPQFVSAFCLLARTHLKSYVLQFDHTTARLDLAKSALAAASRLAPEAGEVQLAEAILLYWGRRDFPAALEKLNQASRSLPNDADVSLFTGLVQRRQGHWEQSLRNFGVAASLDPFDANLLFELANTYLSFRQYEKAADVLDRILIGRDNDFTFQLARAMVDVTARADLSRLETVLSGEAAKAVSPETLAEARVGLALMLRDYEGADKILTSSPVSEGRSWATIAMQEWMHGFIAHLRSDPVKASSAFQKARAAAVRAVEVSPDNNAPALMMLAENDAWLGHKDDAVRVGEEVLKLPQVANDSTVRPDMLTRLAGMHARLGNTERALDLLEESAQVTGGVGYGFLVLGAEWDSLRGERRFEEVLRSLAPKSATP